MNLLLQEDIENKLKIVFGNGNLLMVMIPMRNI